MYRQIILILCALILTACGRSPDDVYQKYNDAVIEGMSFEKEKSFYSERKQQEVEEQVPVYMEQMGKSREEVIGIYLAFSQEVARCKEIELLEERIEGDTAYLVYNQTDTCGNPSDKQAQQKIRLVKDDGWKIDDVEVSM